MKTNPQLALFVIPMLSTTFFQCVDKHDPRYVNSKIPEGFVRDVPIEKEGHLKGQNNSSYQFVNVLANDLGLDSLEGGYDSLQIRIWLGHSLARIKNGVVLKFKEGKWKGQLITYKYVDGRDSITSISAVRPKSGWEILMDSLFKLQILNLPDGEDLIGGPGADGIGYDFEIATSSKYRFYSYANPEHNPDVWQAINVLKIAGLLESEFGFQYTK